MDETEGKKSEEGTLPGISDPVAVEVIEGLLELCAKREREISELSAELERLRSERDEPSPEPTVRHVAPKTDQKRGIMVVDDSPAMRRLLCDLFVSNGLVVVATAENGLEATQLYKDVQPALVTIDIEMPVMDGLEATRRIKELDPEAKVIVVSESLDKSAILEAIKAGASDYVAKPVQPSRLIAAVASLLDV